MKIVETKNKQCEKIFENLISSKRSQSISKLKLVNQIIKNIKKKGDVALFNYTKKFDKININKQSVHCMKMKNFTALHTSIAINWLITQISASKFL